MPQVEQALDEAAAQLLKAFLRLAAAVERGLEAPAVWILPHCLSTAATLEFLTAARARTVTVELLECAAQLQPRGKVKRPLFP